MGILSEELKGTPIEQQYLKPIDFTSINQIPESHAWSHSNDTTFHLDDHHENKQLVDDHMITNNKLDDHDDDNVPLIDLNDPNALELVYNACEKWGVFQVTNHGVSKELLEKLEFQTKRLFSLPFEEKMKVVRTPDGSIGYGSPKIARFYSKLMWHEGFTIMGNSMIEHAKVLWPHEYQEFCDVMEEYQTKMKDLAEKLKTMILKSLSMPESYMTWENEQGPNSKPKNTSTVLQLNSYPICPDPTKAMGLAPHTDSFLFTILHQGNINGLQVLKKDGSKWVSVDPKPNALVVNVGDLLHIISNGRFCNVFHRAVVNTQKHRISAAYFYGPPLDFQVSPFVDYLGCEGPLYRAMEMKEYVKLKQIKNKETLSSIRV